MIGVLVDADPVGFPVCRVKWFGSDEEVAITINVKIEFHGVVRAQGAAIGVDAAQFDEDVIPVVICL